MSRLPAVAMLGALVAATGADKVWSLSARAGTAPVGRGAKRNQRKRRKLLRRRGK